MFNLQPTPQYTLADPPLAQALAQVRFPLVARIQSLEGIVPLQDALAEQFPYMQRSVETSFAVNVSGADIQPEQTVTWQFTDDEGRLLVVGSNQATLSVGKQYNGIGEFASQFEQVLNSLKKAYPIRRCEQIGARFLDLVPDDSEEAGQWKRWFRREIVGWSASEIVHGETQLQAAVSQIQLASPPIDALSVCPADIQAIVRHGLAPAGSVIPGVPPTQFQERSFFLDIDLFVASPQEFDTASIVAQYRALHSQIDRFFRWTLTEEGEKHFGLEEKK